MTAPAQTRRQVLKTTSATIAAAMASMSMSNFVFAGQADQEELVPFLDTPPTPPNRLDWEALDDWLTPQDEVFGVQHYGIPEVNAHSFRLEVGGLVKEPTAFTLDQLQSLPKQDEFMTLECSGNGSAKGFMNAVYNSKWTGARLVPILQACGLQPGAKEVVFFGVDRQEETLRAGTARELTVEVPFGRSMSVEDVLKLNPLLAYERNGQVLEQRNGAPLRLIVPGWYGIACVKWLTRIEVRDRRYMGRFMGRDYVTVRGERHGDEVVFVETSVTSVQLKSVIARITRQPARGERIPLKAYGAAWDDGTGIAKVEVKIDEGPWREAILDSQPRAQYSWVFFSIDLGLVAPGKHVVVSRAIDVNGRIQPSAEDDEIALKQTYWEAYQQWPRDIDLEA